MIKMIWIDGPKGEAEAGPWLADVTVRPGTGARPNLFERRAIQEAPAVHASREAAEEAIWAAHLATRCDCRLSITWARPPPNVERPARFGCSTLDD